MTDNEKPHEKHKYEGQMKGMQRDADKKSQGNSVSAKPLEAAKSAMSGASKGTEAGKSAVPGSKAAAASFVSASAPRPAAKPAAPPASSKSAPPARASHAVAARPAKRWFGRVFAGYALATLAGAATLTAYFLPNADLAGANPQEVGDWIEHFVSLSGLTWPFIALFAAPFALIGLGVAESRRIRDWTYYALFAIGVAVIGFLAKYGVEPDGAARTILNNFAVMAFLTAGLVAGLVYWLVSGRKL